MKYLNDNPEKYWFKRKSYGWGWVPATWQGWLIVLLYIGFIILFALTIDENLDNKIIFTFILPVIFLTIVLLCIAYKKGEKPRWSWGKR